MSGVGHIEIGTADPDGVPTPIFANAGDPPFTAQPERIVLLKDWAQALPHGWPSCPDQTGGDASMLAYPRTIPAGTTITTFACVAKALIEAGAAKSDTGDAITDACNDGEEAL